MLIYEVHLGSWKRKDSGELLSYRELAEELPAYAVEMGFTHIELMPVSEYPFDDSWGYQTTGYYAATSRYGTPEDFMYFVDCCHCLGLGVIIDWVPGHFCKDDHGLRLFDGTALYEHDNSLQGEHKEWGTAVFNVGRCEVQSFLIFNALFWLEIYHIDGIRVDAVASILYLDYGRKYGDWLPNCYGGRENIEAINLMRRLNEVVFNDYPTTLMIAEESTDWAMVTWPTDVGGLEFNYKWNMGWMNDMLEYMSHDPIYRKWQHKLVTFSFLYAFSENFILPLSHDEAVHGKKSLLDKIPGDYWQKLAKLRLFYAYMMAHPSKKLLFMGGEFGQFIEWKYYDSLDWHLLEYEMYKKLFDYVKFLNNFYRQEHSLWEIDNGWQGIEWIDCNDYNQSIITFMRKGNKPDEQVIVVCNFTPVVRDEYRIGVLFAGDYCEVFNSDDELYGGSGQRNPEVITACDIPFHNQSFSVVLKIPPLAAIYLKLVNKSS